MCEVCDSKGLRHSAPSSRRSFFKSAAIVAGSFALAGSALAAEVKAPPKPQNVVSPDEALKLLMKGNARYVSGVAKRHDFTHEREPLVAGQNPYAGILSCADSRIAPEYAFDAARGDLFVCRVAGNFASPEIIASFEYGVAVLNTPLIMVLGHDSCGAVDATIKSIKDKTTLPGHLPSLVTSLTPAVSKSAGQPGDPLANAIRQNVINNVADLTSASEIIAGAVAQKKLRIVGALYRLATGHVELVS